MTALLIAGQDIRELTVGLVLDGRLDREETVSCPPERYLETVVSALGRWQIGRADLGAVVVVVGPGSFTSSRVSTTIANAIAFAGAIPVVSLENPERVPVSELVAKLDWTDLPSLTRFAVPVYDRPPHIT